MGIAAAPITMSTLHRLPALLCAFCLVVGTVLAHGGQYRGPASGGPPGQNVPLNPGAPVAGGPTTGGNANLNINSWQVWWQLNHARYVGQESNATDKDRRDVVMPALALSLERTKSADVLSAGLIALGKATVDSKTIDVLQILRSHLPDANGEVREAAVLALGLSGKTEAIADLEALLHDTRPGRKLVKRSNVNERVRTFAGYALGLLAQRTASADTATLALKPLTAALADKGLKERDVLTGVLNGIRLFGLNDQKSAAFKRVRWQAMDALQKYLQLRMSKKLAVVQSHALTAMAQLAKRGSSNDRERATQAAVEVLQRGRSAEAATYVSAMIALGELLQPTDHDAMQVLVKHVKQPKDSLVPKFAMIALGQIGGATAFEQLQKAFTRGKRDLKPWAALGLGLLTIEPTVQVKSTGKATASKKRSFKTEVHSVLEKALKSSKGELRAAIAIGLGLSGAKQSAPQLRKFVEDTKSEDNKGHLLVALAMLDDRASIRLAGDGMGSIRNAVYYGQSALALARFGERAASATAVSRMGGIRLQPGYLTWLAASAQAIGYLKNAQDLPNLVDLALPKNARSSKRRRVSTGIDDFRNAFAIAAIGSIVDRDPVGFSASIAHGMNYTPREQTISNGTTGILDIF